MYTYSESSILSSSTQIFSDFSHLFCQLSELFFASSLPITDALAMIYTYSESSIFSPSTQIFSHFSHLFRRLSELFFAYILPITSPIAMMYTYSESSIYSPSAQLFSEFYHPKHMYRYLQVPAGMQKPAGTCVPTGTGTCAQVPVDTNTCESTGMDFLVTGTCVKVAGTCKDVLVKVSMSERVKHKRISYCSIQEYCIQRIDKAGVYGESKALIIYCSG